jgi:hypothetical protein
MNYLFIMDDFELTVEAIVDATCGGDRVGSADSELSFIMDNFELTVEAIVDAACGGDRV